MTKAAAIEEKADTLGTFYLSPGTIDTAYLPDVRTNSRTAEAIKLKKQSMAKLGQISPIGVVRKPDGGWAVKFGRTRLAAMVELEKEGLPPDSALESTDIRCEEVVDEFDDIRTKLVALTENTGSTPMTEVEIGNRIKELEDAGGKLKDIASTIGISQSQARIYRDVVTEAAPEIQQLVVKGEISSSAVQKLVAKGADGTRLSHEEQLEAVRPLLEAGKALTRDAVQDVAGEAKAKKSGASGNSGALTGQALDQYFLAIVDTEDPKASKHGEAVAESVVKFCKDFIKFRQGAMSKAAFTNRLFKFAAGPQGK